MGKKENNWEKEFYFRKGDYVDNSIKKFLDGIIEMDQVVLWNDKYKKSYIIKITIKEVD